MRSVSVLSLRFRKKCGMRSACKWERVWKERLCPFVERTEVLSVFFFSYIRSFFVPDPFAFLSSHFPAFLLYISRNSLKHYVHILRMLSRDPFVFVAGIMLLSVEENYTD